MIAEDCTATVVKFDAPPLPYREQRLSKVSRALVRQLRRDRPPSHERSAATRATPGGNAHVQVPLSIVLYATVNPSLPNAAAQTLPLFSRVKSASRIRHRRRERAALNTTQSVAQARGLPALNSPPT